MVSIQGCATSTSKWMGSGLVSFKETKQVDTNTYVLVANGAGNNTKAEVEEAFHLRAK